MNRRHLTLSLFLALAALTLFQLGCDSASNPVAPAGTVLTATANPTKIAPGGETSTITITGFRPDGNPLNPGTLITLTLGGGGGDGGGSGVGILSTNSVTIGDNGTAQATLISDERTGTASVTATLTAGGGGDGSAMASTTVTIALDDPPAPQLQLFANPGTVGVGGRSDITIVARDANSIPLGAGEVIQLVAEFGSLNATTVETDSSGQAFARFIAGDRPGQGTVTAFLSNSDSSTSSVAITINDAPSSFSFTTDVGRVSQASDATIEVTVAVLNSLGSPLPGASVTFDVEDINGGTVGGTFGSGSFVQTTDSSGRVVDVLTIPQGQLTAGVDFFITATVRGEGVELPAISRRITVDP